MDHVITKSLIFRLGEESIPNVISKENLDMSPFADTIRRAYERLSSIANQLEKIGRAEVKSNENQESWLEETPNNIIAFLGDRGAGKTSCMRSLIRVLKDDEKDRKEKHEGGDRWLFSNEIDPSFFDEDHNVLEILIGSLYGIFKDECKDLGKKSQKTRDDLRKIQEKFKDVKSALRFLKSIPDLSEEYEIDALKHLDEGGKIRLLLKNLVDELLAFKNKEILVVTIDDLDLNIERSYLMMEHIRKYLILPNVVVIIAAKFTQLFDSVCRDLTKVYKDLEYRVSHMDIAEMAERYLNKIFPLDQRFEMPSVESYMDVELKIISADGITLYENEDVKLTVPSLIFTKTRYLFYNSSGMPSLVIPRNLRDLRMLVSLLANMKDYSDETQALNKRVFKDYFFNEWLGIIEPAYRKFAKGLLDEENLAKINLYVVKNLYHLFLSKIQTYSELMDDVEKRSIQKRASSLQRERKLLLDILNPSNSYWNVSVGDVVFVMNEVRKSHDSSEVLALLFFIESFYSMKLYETYDKLTLMTDDSGLNLPAEKNTTAPELKTSVRGDVPEYFRFVGGSFFAPTGDYFTPLSLTDKSPSREYTVINGRRLMDFIRSVEKQYQDLFPEGSDDKDVIIPSALSEHLRFCEFFMLTVKLREDSRSFGALYRLANDPLYFKNFGYTSMYMVFDITMPFFNAVYPEFAYSRFGKRLYEFAKKDKNSLLNKMIHHRSREKNNDTWELMSKAALRNMEILEDITAWLHNNREDGKLSGPNIMKVFQSFYNQFLIPSKGKENASDSTKDKEQTIPKGRYLVKTYGKTSDEKSEPYYYIDYSIYSELANVVSEIENPDFDSSKYSINVSSPSEKDSKSSEDDPTALNKVNIEDEDTRKARRLELRALFYAIFAYENIFLEKDIYSYHEISDALTPYLGKPIVDILLESDDDLFYNSESLAEILAEIRVEYGYDFDGNIPDHLQIFYDKHVLLISQKKIRPLEISKAHVENQISQVNSDISSLTDANKKLRQEITQSEKEVKKLEEDESINIDRRISENLRYIDYLKLKINEAIDKTEYTRLRKEEEKTTKALHSLYASQEELPNRVEKLNKRVSSNKEDISKNEAKIDSLRNDRIQLEVNLRTIIDDLNELKYIKDHPKKLELKLSI